MTDFMSFIGCRLSNLQMAKKELHETFFDPSAATPEEIDSVINKYALSWDLLLEDEKRELLF